MFSGFREFLRHFPYFLAWWTAWQVTDALHEWIWALVKAGVASAGLR